MLLGKPLSCKYVVLFVVSSSAVKKCGRFFSTEDLVSVVAAAAHWVTMLH